MKRIIPSTQASHLKIWSLVRHTAGMLGKSVDNLGEVGKSSIISALTLIISPLLNNWNWNVKSELIQKKPEDIG